MTPGSSWRNSVTARARTMTAPTSSASPPISPPTGTVGAAELTGAADYASALPPTHEADTLEVAVANQMLRRLEAALLSQPAAAWTCS